MSVKAKSSRLWRAIEKTERRLLAKALVENGNNLPQAALALGIEHTTFYKKAIKLGLFKKGERAPGAFPRKRSAKRQKAVSLYSWVASSVNGRSAPSGEDSPPPAARGPSWLIEAVKPK
jgi:hypothetical protein